MAHTLNRPAHAHRLLARHRHRPSIASLVGLCLALAGLTLGIVGCEPRTVSRPDNPPPTATYTGPEYLRGSVGSMANLRNYEPMLVSGFGLVVGLDGTGSQEVPAFLRQRMLNRLRQMGVGSTRIRREMPEAFQPFARMSPEQLLADPSTAIVAVQGFIPAGAVRGARFDVLVSALPQTQTTSLAGGTLWTTDLSLDGTNPAVGFSRTRAEANGPIYINPFDEESDEDDQRRFLRQAMVVAGGKVTLPQQIELVLNQSSWNRSRAIADRINERFPAGPGSRQQTAVPQTAMVIHINVPRDYATRPDVLMELVAHLYIQRGPNFETEQAERLARRLREDSDRQERVVLAWRSLGRTILPVLRNYYEDEDPVLSLAALEAGAWLQDERAGLVLASLARSSDEPQARQRVAEALVYLPRSTSGSRALKALLDDDDTAVRIAAYESLAAINDPIIDRMPIRNANGLKFVIDRVPAEKPMIYITQEHFPRLVIFDDQLGFRTPMFAQMWDSRLMVRSDDEEAALNVYYQRPGTIEGKQYEVWPNVASLAYLLAHSPEPGTDEKGLDLTYSQVVETIYRFANRGHIAAPVEVNTGPLAQLIAEYEETVDQLRPEIGDETPEPMLGPEPVTEGDWLDRPGQPTGRDRTEGVPWMGGGSPGVSSPDAGRPELPGDNTQQPTRSPGTDPPILTQPEDN
ncbi:flagellar basal body P-ring protein FlgI [Phycisphaerales bacterium AB-hyl4]|uniref:Flagellar basal body P-ring protein FlgI n=1 Tax=Natronomicrosphaera hydrolytica TaxID=3242702 RepID=A0ABV4U331_9BACT